MKLGKAPRFDGIQPESLICLRKYARELLARFYTDILQSGKISDTLKRAKIVSILKPSKSNNNPQSYRPNALLSFM